jgi:hypothetical protein
VFVPLAVLPVVPAAAVEDEVFPAVVPLAVLAAPAAAVDDEVFPAATPPMEAFGSTVGLALGVWLGVADGVALGVAGLLTT